MIAKAIANALILVGTALTLIFVTQIVDDTTLADLTVLFWGLLMAVVGGFLKGWLKIV